MRAIEEVKSEIKQAQHEMMIAIDNSDVQEAYRLEKRIDELQKELFRLKTCEE
jgi:hypothetical protein